MTDWLADWLKMCVCESDMSCEVHVWSRRSTRTLVFCIIKPYYQSLVCIFMANISRFLKRRFVWKGSLKCQVIYVWIFFYYHYLNERSVAFFQQFNRWTSHVVHGTMNITIVFSLNERCAITFNWITVKLFINCIRYLNAFKAVACRLQFQRHCNETTLFIYIYMWWFNPMQSSSFHIFCRCRHRHRLLSLN